MSKYFLAAVSFLLLTTAVFAKTSMAKGKTISYMSMERTACFGRCPMYMVEIYQNGTVRYTGRKFVDFLGVYESNIGSKKAQAIIKKFTSSRIDTCKELYEMNIADLPGLIYTFTINGKKKEIHNAHFGPKFLSILADEVDMVVKPDSKWKKIKDAPKE